MLAQYANEVRQGFTALLTTLIALGDLLEEPEDFEAQRRWRENRRRLKEEGWLR